MLVSYFTCEPGPYNNLVMALQDGFGRFLHPPNDIYGNAAVQVCFGLSDNVDVSWLSYLLDQSQSWNESTCCVAHHCQSISPAKLTTVHR